jgi:hypothetical protein
MTDPYEDKYVIRVNSGEIQSVVGRIEVEYSPLPTFTVGPYGLGFEDRSVAEALIDNPRINREGKAEMQLEADPSRSNIAF